MSCAGAMADHARFAALTRRSQRDREEHASSTDEAEDDGQKVMKLCRWIPGDGFELWLQDHLVE